MMTSPTRVRRGLAQEVRGDVALEVVDGRQRQPARGGDRLRGRDADEQRADEARPLRDRDEVDVGERRAGAAQRVVDGGVGELEVVARGDLRHDAAVGVVDALRGDDVRAHLAVARDDRRAGVVAAGLQREDELGRAHTGAGLGTSSYVPASVDGRAPHDHGVLAVVGVVAPAAAGGTKAVALVQGDRADVGLAHLEREARARVVDALDERQQQRRRDPAAAQLGVDGDVHDVPDGVVARADRGSRRASRPAAPPAARRSTSTARARTSPATTASRTRAARARRSAGDRRRSGGGW